VHELGHFVVAKLSGMRVDEFGIGYPPRIFAVKGGETEYSINALPFGGFVKIFGEELGATKVEGGDSRAFSAKPRHLQALVLVAGIAMNLILAWLIFSFLLMGRHWVGDGVFTNGLPLFSALAEGARITWQVTSATTTGLAQFFASIFTLSANLSEVSGPIGIAEAVGDASASGLQNLFSLIAIISVNLAVINLLPVPALDGGRLLFVLIETVIRRPIKAVVANTVNSIGFAFLILLMVVVTAHDIFKFF
jgi:regulator of sigma E protease